MLVLSRKECEAVHIGPDIVITVVRLGRGRVQLGIDARRTSASGAMRSPKRARRW